MVDPFYAALRMSGIRHLPEWKEGRRIRDFHIVHMYNDGASIRQCAERYDITRERVRQILVEKGAR